MQYVVWVLVIVVPFFIFFVRPQRRQMQAAAAMQARLAAGETVITTSGIYGTIIHLDDETADLEVAPGTTIKIVRRAIGRRLADLELPEPPDRSQD